jgi:hypothetical protein
VSPTSPSHSPRTTGSPSGASGPAHPDETVWVPFDGDQVSEALSCLDDLWDRLRLTAVLIALLGLAVAGAGALVGLSYGVALIVGLVAASVGAGALWVRARRRVTTLLGED